MSDEQQGPAVGTVAWYAEQMHAKRQQNMDIINGRVSSVQQPQTGSAYTLPVQQTQPQAPPVDGPAEGTTAWYAKQFRETRQRLGIEPATK